MKQLIILPLLAISIGAMAQTSESLMGCWEMKSRAGEHIQLMRDGSFSFHDYNAKTKAWDDLSGTWAYKGGKLALLYADRSKQNFAVTKTGSSWMLTKAGGFKMMKTDPSKCGM